MGNNKKKSTQKKTFFFHFNIEKKMCQKIKKGHKKIKLKHYEDKLKSKNSITFIKFLKKVKNIKFFL